MNPSYQLACEDVVQDVEWIAQILTTHSAIAGTKSNVFSTTVLNITLSGNVA